MSGAFWQEPYIFLEIVFQSISQTILQSRVHSNVQSIFKAVLKPLPRHDSPLFGTDSKTIEHFQPTSYHCRLLPTWSTSTETDLVDEKHETSPPQSKLTSKGSKHSCPAVSRGFGIRLIFPKGQLSKSTFADMGNQHRDRPSRRKTRNKSALNQINIERKQAQLPRSFKRIWDSTELFRKDN
jgi:hypothetical protein